MSLSAEGLTLYIWPSKWGLPSIEPSCIAAAFYLQLALPGRFTIRECTNPDVSPSGQLPYLAHGHHIVTPLSSIIKYVAALTPTSVPPVAEGGASEPAFSADVDVMLDPSERAKRTAWFAHVETALGDLMAYAFYSLNENYAAVMHPTLSSFYKVPQSYYVPHRIRQLHQARLEASGLWTAPENETGEVHPKRFGAKQEPKNEDPEQLFKGAFQRERVLEKSRAAFGIYSRLLGEKNFFFYDRPTTLDLVLASHILLLVQAPLPDTLLSSLLSSSYPTLLLHARRVLEAAAPSTRILPPEQFSLSGLIPYPSFRAWWSKPCPQKSEEEKHFERMRWQWIGLAVLGSIGYWVIWAPKLRFVRLEDDDEDGNLAIVVEGNTGDLDEEEDEDGVDEPYDDDEGNVKTEAG